MKDCKMKRSSDRCLVSGVLVLSVLLFTGPAAAQPAADSPAERTGERMSVLDKQMLDWTTECAKECANAIEGWIAKKETTEQKLFSSLYYPIPNTDPVKFTTDWDKLSDRDILAIEERYLNKASAIAFVVLVDKNGYLPTHNKRYSQPLTGKGSIDLYYNRTKRIFNDRTGLAAAKNTEPFLIQQYRRDTGERMVDLSVPVMIRGKHWGALRIGYRTDTE
jgi:hypothetical protein